MIGINEYYLLPFSSLVMSDGTVSLQAEFTNYRDDGDDDADCGIF